MLALFEKSLGRKYLWVILYSPCTQVAHNFYSLYQFSTSFTIKFAAAEGRAPKTAAAEDWVPKMAAAQGRAPKTAVAEDRAPKMAAAGGWALKFEMVNLTSNPFAYQRRTDLLTAYSSILAFHSFTAKTIAGALRTFSQNQSPIDSSINCEKA